LRQPWSDPPWHACKRSFKDAFASAGQAEPERNGLQPIPSAAGPFELGKAKWGLRPALGLGAPGALPSAPGALQAAPLVPPAAGPRACSLHLGGRAVLPSALPSISSQTAVAVPAAVSAASAVSVVSVPAAVAPPAAARVAPVATPTAVEPAAPPARRAQPATVGKTAAKVSRPALVEPETEQAAPADDGAPPVVKRVLNKGGGEGKPATVNAPP